MRVETLTVYDNHVATGLESRGVRTMNKKLSFWLIGYSLLVLMIGTNLPSPLYAIYKDMFGFSSLTLTLIFAAYALVLIPSLAVFGKMSDRFGRKWVICIGVIVSLAGSMVFIAANSVKLLFAARILQGISVGLLSGAATAALAELNPYNKKTAPLVASLATAGGTALGPLVGGVLAQYGAYPLLTPFFAHIILALPCVAGVLLMKEHKEAINAESVPRNNSVSSSTHISRQFQLSALTAFIAWSVTALFMSIIPSYISSFLGIKNLALTGGVVFLMLGSSVIAQLVFRQLDYTRSMRTGLVLLIGGLIGIIIAVPLQMMSLLVIGTVLAGTGQGLSFKGSMELVNIISPPEHRGVMVSRLYVVIYMGVGVPIIGVGTISLVIGLYYSILIYACIVSLLSTVLFVLLLFLDQIPENVIGER